MDTYTISHFSLANVNGPEETRTPALLRKLADILEEESITKIQDIVFENAVEDGERVPTFTVYYK